MTTEEETFEIELSLDLFRRLVVLLESTEGEEAELLKDMICTSAFTHKMEAGGE